jgi:hypothetical protein
MWKSFASDLREEWSEPADECNDPFSTTEKCTARKEDFTGAA